WAPGSHLLNAPGGGARAERKAACKPTWRYQRKITKTAKKLEEMMKPKLRALICDLDGTLVDSEPNYRKADIRFLDSYGVSMTEPEWDGVIGMGSEAFISMGRERLAIGRPIDVLLRENNESYLEIARGATFAFPEVATFVAEARGALPCMAVASGSSLEIIRMSLESSGLAAYFDVLVSAEEVPRGKPAPDIFLEAARRLGVHPD